MKPTSLQQRLSLYVLVPVAVLLLAMGYIGFLYAKHSLLNQWAETSNLKLQRAAHFVDMQLRRAQGNPLGARRPRPRLNLRSGDGHVYRVGRCGNGSRGRSRILLHRECLHRLGRREGRGHRHGRRLGDRRGRRRAFRQAAPAGGGSPPSRPAQEILAAVVEEVAAFRDGKESEDDVTLVVIKALDSGSLTIKCT